MRARPGRRSSKQADESSGFSCARRHKKTELTPRWEVGAIHVHEFMSLDGVIDTPTWTFGYGFDPKMGVTIGAITERCRGILLGRTTYEMFEPAWSTRTVGDD